MEAQEVILEPVITEKATAQTDRYNKVAFRVAKRASKYQIRAAVEALYGVRVTGIRTSTVRGKLKRRGVSVGKRPDWKKALVTLREGDVIDFFATE